MPSLLLQNYLQRYYRAKYCLHCCYSVTTFNVITELNIAFIVATELLPSSLLPSLLLQSNYLITELNIAFIVATELLPSSLLPSLLLQSNYLQRYYRAKYCLHCCYRVTTFNVITELNIAFIVATAIAFIVVTELLSSSLLQSHSSLLPQCYCLHRCYLHYCYRVTTFNVITELNIAFIVATELLPSSLLPSLLLQSNYLQRYYRAKHCLHCCYRVTTLNVITELNIAFIVVTV